jgi:HEAT repeat protein
MTMDLATAEVDELFQLARSSEDPEAYWACVNQLQVRGGERAFRLASVLCDSILAGERCLGADVLGKLDGYSEQSRVMLRPLLDDDSPAVLAAAAASAGFTHDEQSVERLAALTSHPERGVRFAAVTALLRLDDERGVAALVELSADGDGEVREWAEGALEQLRGSAEA